MRCSAACRAQKEPLSGTWDNFFAQGFIVWEGTGRCYCESASSDDCNVANSGISWDRYDWTMDACLVSNGGCDSKRTCINSEGSTSCGDCSGEWFNDGAKGCKGLCWPVGLCVGLYLSRRQHIEDSARNLFQFRSARHSCPCSLRTRTRKSIRRRVQ